MLNKSSPALGALALLIACSGCASTNDIMHNEVDEVFHTPMSVSEVTSCFETHNHARVLERPDGARVFEAKNGLGGVVRAFAIYPEGTGSRIDVRHSAIGVLGYVWKRCVGLQPAKAASANS